MSSTKNCGAKTNIRAQFVVGSGFCPLTEGSTNAKSTVRLLMCEMFGAEF